MQKINKSGFCKDENLKQVCCACSTFGCVFLMKKNDLCLVQLPPPPIVLFSKQHHSIQKRARVVTSYIQICTPKQSVFSRRCFRPNVCIYCIAINFIMFNDVYSTTYNVHCIVLINIFFIFLFLIIILTSSLCWQKEL